MLEYIVSVGFKSQKLGELTSQIDESLADVKVVSIVIVYTLGVACHVHLFAQ